MNESKIIRLIEERLAYLYYDCTGSDYDWGQFVALRDLKQEINERERRMYVWVVTEYDENGCVYIDKIFEKEADAHIYITKRQENVNRKFRKECHSVE